MTRIHQRQFTALFFAISLAVISLNALAQSDTPDYASYRVIDVQEFEELYAGSARSSAALAPSGDLFVNVTRDGELCVYLLEASWRRAGCRSLGSVRIDGNGLLISPDGRWAVLPTFKDAVQFFRDTDIQVINLAAGAPINLTDDGYEGGTLFRSDVLPRDANIDIAPVWLSDQQIAFLRYAADPSGADEGRGILPASIYTIEITASGASSEAQELIALGFDPFITTYALTASRDGARLAFNRISRDENMGIWEVDSTSGERRQLLQIDQAPAVPSFLSYSADSRYLLFAASDPAFPAPTFRVLDVETGELIEIDPRFPQRSDPADASASGAAPLISAAGWSPSGAALIYAVVSQANPELEGLYISPQPGEPGRMILEGRFYATTCCANTTLQWGANDVILVGRGAQPGLLLIQVG
jgi:hypothetical protein